MQLLDRLRNDFGMLQNIIMDDLLDRGLIGRADAGGSLNGERGAGSGGDEGESAKGHLDGPVGKGRAKARPVLICHCYLFFRRCSTAAREVMAISCARR